MIRRYFDVIGPAAPTIRFMLCVASIVCFMLALLGVHFTSDSGSIGWLGLLFLTATVLFLDPENPPGPHVDPKDAVD